MPTYEYQCDKCSHNFDKVQSFKDKPLKKCPACKKLALKKVIHAPYYIPEVKTLGGVAEKNTREMGKYRLEDKRKSQEDNANKFKLESLKTIGVVPENATELPKVQKSLDKLRDVIKDPKKTKDYILKGKK